MANRNFNPRFSVLILFMLGAALVRILQTIPGGAWSNFTPMGAMALFGGAYFQKRWQSFLFPLFTLWVSDLFINAVIYRGAYGLMYGGWYWVYGGFALMVVMASVLLKKINLPRVLLTGLGATLLYWMLVDFGVFLFGCTDIRTGQIMDHSLESLFRCYVQGFPFIRNFALSTLLYSGMLFGSFEWLRRHKPGVVSFQKLG